MTHTYINKGFPGMFTAIVAEASMTMPPFSGEDDAAFLDIMVGNVMDVFWSNFVSTCALSAQQEYTAAVEAADADRVTKWFETHADFMKDENAKDRAEAVLQDIAANLPPLLKQEYESFKAELHTQK